MARAARALAGRGDATWQASRAAREGLYWFSKPISKNFRFKNLSEKNLFRGRAAARVGCARLRVAGAPEGCRFAAAGPNKVKQQGAGAARAA